VVYRAHYVASFPFSSPPPFSVVSLFLSRSPFRSSQFHSLSSSVSFQMFRSIFLPPPLPHSTRALAFRGDVYAHVHTRCARCTRLARVSGVRISGRIHTNTHANSHVDEGTRMVECGAQSCRHRFASRIRMNPWSSCVSLFCILTVVPSCLGVLIF